jgi:DNA-binding NarL/FixJ family response regulator
MTHTLPLPAESPPIGGTHQARILLVDDHPLIRQAVRETLEQESDFTVCGEAADAASTLEALPSLRPNLILLDLSLGDSNGMDLIPRILALLPSTQILVLSMHDEALYAERAIHAGARGYVNKRETPDTIIKAVRTVLAGRVHLNPAILARILASASNTMLYPH